MTTAVAEQTRTVTNEVTPPDQLDFTGFNFAGGSGAGYYPSPNILIDDLLASGQIDAYDFTIISYIIRSTLGSKHKKSFKWIALTSIATQCNLSLSLVRDRLKVLADKSIVYRLDFMNQGVNQTWLAVNTDESTELIRRLAMNEIKPSYITGSQHTSILNRCFDTIKDKASKIVAMLSKTETLNTTPPPPKTPLPVFSDAVGVLNTVEAIPETGNKNKDIKDISKKTCNILGLFVCLFF